MYFRYYQNWLHESYDYTTNRMQRRTTSKRLSVMESLFCTLINILNSLMKCAHRRKRFLSILIVPLVNSINNFLDKFLPIIEPIFLKIMKFLEPLTDRISKKMISFVDKANPLIFEVQSIKEGEKFG
jgi:hypothetical protein